jgi:hypothetical protein
MRRDLSLSFLLGLAVTTLGSAACGEAEGLEDAGTSDLGLADSGVDPGSDGGPADSGSAATVTVRGKVETWLSLGAPSGPIAGATICLRQPDGPCVNSDAAGDYVLDGVPAQSEVLLEYAAAGYPTMIVPLETRAASGTLDLGLYDDGTFAAWHGQAGVPADPGRGIVLLQLAAPDVTATLNPMSGTRTYRTLNGEVDPALSRSEGDGWAVFFGVEPGTYRVNADHATRLCRRGRVGWPDADEETARVVVQGDRITRVTLACRVP